MKRYKVIVRPAADFDINQIFSAIYNASRNVETALRYVEALYGKIQKLEISPRAGGRIVHDDAEIRMVSFRKTYLILYEVSGAEIRILRVYDGRRNMLPARR